MAVVILYGLFSMEPHVNPAAFGALYRPDAGNLIRYEYAIALAENAVDNGVELRIRREVNYKYEYGRPSNGSLTVLWCYGVELSR